MKRLREGQIVYGRHGREYKIHLVKYIKPSKGDDLGEFSVYAQIDRAKKIIRIKSDVDTPDQHMLLLHELLHDHAEDWEEYDLTKEMFVSILAGELFDCLRRNNLGFI